MPLPIKHLTRYGLVIACIMSGIQPLFAVEVANTKLSIKPGAPEGFEQLDEPHETAVDLSYGGLKIGSFRATFTPKSVTFLKPDEIVQKIPALKKDSEMRVLTALSGALATHADSLCGHIAKPGCGLLKPDIAAVIFDEDHFSANLFVNANMLEEQDTHNDKILPPAPDVLSSVHTINGNITGSDNSSANYSLQNNSTVAYGPGRVNLTGSASNKVKQISTAAASLDKWGLDNKVGFFDSRASQLLPQSHMSGVSVGTSLNTNLALRDASGSRLSIFLPQRSYVSLIYNNVLYSTELYEAGNQVLNTDSLPEGAYNVTIRIRDMTGVQTEETRFFAKNFEIPPADQSIYYGQIGTLRDSTQQSHLPQIGSGLVATAGTVQRYTENVGIDANLLVIKNHAFTETGAFLLLPPDNQIRAATLLSSAGDYGFGTSYLGYMYDKKLAIAANARALFAGKTSAMPDPNEPVPADSKQLSSSMTYQLSEATNLGVQANYSTATTKDKYAYGPTLHHDFWREGESNLTLTADSSATQDGPVHSILLRYTKRLGAWGLNGDGNIRGGSKTAVGGTNLSKSGDTRVTWNDDKDPSQMTVVGAETRHDDLTDSYTTDLDHRGSLGNIKLSGTQTQSSQGTHQIYFGNIGFGIAQSGSNISWGGNQQQGSGFIVKTSGNSEDIPMKVMIGSTEKASFKTGGTAALFVAPYQTYNISIKPAQSSAIDYDGTVKHVTLYPGNILPMVWDINRINVVLGHVVLPDGSPLTNAKLEQARNLSYTDEDGLFQAELLDLGKITFHRAAEEEAPAVITKADREDLDIFSILPHFHTHQSRPNKKMSAEEQNKAMIDLYGADDTALPAPETPAETPPAPAASGPAISPNPEAPSDIAEDELSPELPQSKVRMSPRPPKKLAPELRCEVILPDAKEMNGVFIYSEPLVCNEIPLEPDAPAGGIQVNKPEEDDSNKSAFNQLFGIKTSLGRPFPHLYTLEETPLTTTETIAYLSTPLNQPIDGLASWEPEAARPVMVAHAIHKQPNTQARVQTAATPVTAAPDATSKPEDVFFAQKTGPAIVQPALLPQPGAGEKPAAVAVAKPAAPVIAEEKKAVPAAPEVADASTVVKTHAPAILVQVGAYRSQAKAESVQHLITRKFPETADKKPYIIKSDLGEKGIYYRLRIGDFANASDAASFCAILSSKGQPCIVPPEEIQHAGLPDDDASEPATSSHRPKSSTATSPGMQTVSPTPTIR